VGASSASSFSKSNNWWYCREGLRRRDGAEGECEFAVRDRRVVCVEAKSLVRAARLSRPARLRGDVHACRGVPRSYAGRHDPPEARPAPTASSAPCQIRASTPSTPGAQIRAAASAAVRFSPSASGRSDAAARYHPAKARRPPAPSSGEEEVEAEEATRGAGHPAQQAPYARAGRLFAGPPRG
jgi:hypothetical protein